MNEGERELNKSQTYLYWLGNWTGGKIREQEDFKGENVEKKVVDQLSSTRSINRNVYKGRQAKRCRVRQKIGRLMTASAPPSKKKRLGGRRER